MGVRERYNERKKQNTSNGRTTDGVRERRKYNSIDTSNVNEQYINSFISDAKKFLSSAQEEYGKVGWSNAASSYENINKSYSDLNTKFDTVKAWLYKNKNNLDERSYNSFLSSFNRIDRGLSSVLEKFANAKDFYSQYTEEEYNDILREQGYRKKYEGKTYDEIMSVLGTLEDGEEKEWLDYNKYNYYKNNADFSEKSKYVSTYLGGEEYNPWSNSYSDTGFDDIDYDYINRNEKATKIQGLNDVSFGATFAGVSNGERLGMTNDEIAIFNYIYATHQDKKPAYDYITHLTSDLNARERAAAEAMWAKMAEESPVESSLHSVIMSPLKGISYIVQVGDYIEDGKIDQNDSYNKFSYIPSAIRNEVTQNVEENWGSVGSFTYQMGMSMADFLLTTGVSGGNSTVALAIMGTGAAADTVIYSKDRGLTDNQAFALGTIAGVAEIATEKLSIDALLDASTLGKSAIGYVLKNTLAEGSEEVGSSLINLVADVLFSKDKSEWQAAIDAYRAEDMNESDAFWHAVRDQALSLGLDFLGGAISGGVMGGGGATINTANKFIQGINFNNAYGKDIGGILASEALGLDPNNAFAQRMQKKANNGKTLSPFQIVKLIQQNDTAKIKSNIKTRLTELGEKGDIGKLSEALTKRLIGESLSLSEKALIKNSTFGKRIINETNPDNIEAGTYASGWAENIGTRALNPQAYNKSAYDLAKQMHGIREAVEKESVDKTLAETGKTIEENIKVSENGKTIYNDEDVAINKIVSTKGGLKVELDNGKTVSARDLSFGTKEEAIMYEMVARMETTPETANELISTFKPANMAKASQYFTSIPVAYQYGKIGYEAGLKNINLTKQEKRLAYNRGRADAIIAPKNKTSVPTKGKANTTKTEAPKTEKNGIIYEGGFTYDESTATKMQKASMAHIEVISKMSSLEVHVFESVEKNGKRVFDLNGERKLAPNGYFTDGNKIYIDFYAGDGGEGAMLYTMSHEVSHYIRKWNEKGFKELADFLIEQYGKHGMYVHKLLEDQKTKIKNRYERENKTVPSEAKLADMAYEELVADAMSDMLTDPKAYEKLLKLKQKNRTLWEKVGEAIKQLLDKLKTALGIYKTADVRVALEAYFVREFTSDVYNKLQDLYLKAFAEADANYEAAMNDGSIDLDGNDNAHLFSDRTIVEGAGLQFILSENGTDYKVLDKNGKPVKNVTAEMIVNSPLGNLVTMAKNEGFLGKGKEATLAANKQYEFLAELVNMCIDYNGLAPIWETAGTMVFSSMKSNADKQYGLTVDFSTVCKKTQAIVDAMSEAMLRLGRGLTRSEVETIYLEVGKAGESTPCPVCYVFSRWMGIGGILDQISRFQDKYTAMSEKSLQKFIADIQERIRETANTPDNNGKLKSKFFNAKGEISEGKVIAETKSKASNKAASALKAIANNANIKLQIQELEALMQNQDSKSAKKTAKQIENLKNKLQDEASLEKEMHEANDTLEEYEAYQWLTRTMMTESEGKWVKNSAFKPVPKDILFDLNKGDKFAEGYPLSWAFRTGKGASAGKAIVPYADARVGEAIQAVASQSPKDIKIGLELNPFLNSDTAGRLKILKSAIEKQARQNLLGGQRYQSTSDFRYEYGSDYLITFLEMQAIGAKVQLYTKVIEAVDFLASMGADCNLSVMPLSDGFITLPDGTKKLVYSSVTGINAEAAIKKAHEYNNVQLILVGISDEHIRLALEGMDVTFVIPFHGSGNSVHQIQALMNLLGENLDVTTAHDYTLVQSDHVSPNQTKEQKAMWNLRVKIVQGNASTITAAEQALLDKNSFLKDLYRRFYIDKNADEYGVGLTSGQSEQIFPYEYWDKSLTYAEADKNGDRFKEYCASMGIIPRFSGLDSKGERVTYENEAKEKIPYGDFTNNKGYWKLLIDRPMYDNTYDADGNWTGYGKYHEQARINCSNFNVKHLDPEYGSATYGEVMSKANDPKKTNKIVDAALKRFEDAKFSDRGSWENIESVQGLDGYSVDEVINITTNHINNILEEYGEYAEIIAVRPYGSRAKGTAKTNSDLDIVVQYEGDIREDDMFNMLNDDDGKLYIDGIEVDINPIRVEESGDIEDYLGRVYSFDKYQDAKFSDRDSLGNKLSAEQQEFFKDSKARDKKGNLMVLYHGTTANFNTFKKGDVGFHFGTKGAARGRVGFGKNATLKEVYLNITNPIVFDEDLGSWDADFRLTRELYDMGILTQEDAESVLFTDDRQYRRTTEKANKKLAEVLLSKGYDGIAYQNTFETKKASTSYIVFNSNQAKEITNKTPTSDPDIRFSDRNSSYEDYNKPITTEDVEVLRSMASKSINEFTTEDIRLTQKWAYKFYKELGEKSPFFRAWFGDWRAYEPTSTKVIDANRAEGKNPRGKFRNRDTGWEINSSSVGYDETVSHSGKNKKSIIAMQNIDKIIENAILLDTEVSEYGRGKKSVYTAFMHKFYSLCRINGKLYIAKMAVDESYAPGQDNTNKKFYHVRAIEIETASSVGIGESHTPIIEDTVSDISITDLFKFVKRYDEKFKPNAVNPLLLNEGGTPKVFYHGTNKKFSIFDIERAGQNWNGDSRLGKGFYFANTEHEALQWTEGTNVIKAYLNLKNPLNVDAPVPKNIAKEIDKYIDNKIASFDESSSFISKEQYIKNLQRIKEMYMNDVSMFIDNFKYDENGKMTDGIREFLSSLKYDGIISKDEVVAFYPEQIKSATDNIGTFNKAEEDIHYSDRGTNTISNRSLLAGALEGVAQNDIEKAKLAQYKAKIALIESEHKKLNELKAEANKLRFTKGRTAEETKRMKALDFEANQVANRINTYDKQLLNLESTKALKSVLEREKANLRKRLEQKGKESLKKQKEKDAATVRELMNRYQESRHKAVEGRHKTELRGKIKDVVSKLNKLLLNPTKEQHVPIGLQLVVSEALDAINMDTMNAEERVAYYNDLIAKSSDPDEIAMLTKKRDFFEYRDANFKDRITALKNAYAEFKESDDPLIRNAHNEAIEDLIKNTADEVGNKSLKDMSYEQLEKVHNMYKAILATVRNSNKMFKEGRQATVTENSEAVKTEVKEVGGHKDRVLKLTKALKRFGWAMLKPVTAMKVIGSKTFEELFKNVRAAEDTWAVDVNEAKKFYDDVAAKYSYKKWDFKKRYTFKDSTGTDFSISLEQMMSLYAYSKREQADQHLEFGGFIFDDAIEVTEKKLGVPLKYEVNDANPYRLGQIQIMEIIGNLSQDQKAFVDEMQTYLSEVMGEKGNEVSLAMYDIKLYNEKNYFPLKTARYFREFDPEKNATPKIKNSGFSKKTVPQAGNPIVLSNFMDVWATHVNDMSMYHAFVLPLEDFMRVYNYSSTAGGYDSVQQYIKNAYGSQANQYIERLMEDLNGGARVDSSAGFINKGLSLFKKASTFASASVVIQQPSAIARALAYINPKYFVTSLPSAINLVKHRALWAEVKKYAPVAIIKEMGYFDTGVGRSTVEWLKGNQSIKDKVDDVLSKAPAIADELGWTYIWEAVKRETQATTNLKVGSEEFLKKSGERFTEVITNTQVYDSTLSRSAMMRSKDTGMKMATAFMAEPTTTVNMMVDGILQGMRGNKKFAAATAGAISASIILNSILVSLVYAARDDDDDETYAEKYIGSLTTELLDGFNPLTYIPFIKDIWSIAQGYDVERSDMSVVSNLWETIEGLFEEDKSGWEKVLDATGAVSSLFGIPLKNIIRDGKGMYNLTKTLISGTPTTGAGISGAIEDSLKSAIPLWDRLHESDSKSDNLYDAIISGDQNQIDRIKGQYKDEKAIESAMRQALRENDSRIHEAAQARYEGDIAEYTRIAREIIAEGNFSQDTVVSAINAEISAIKRGETTEEDPAEDERKDEATSIYKASDISSALENGDTSMARQIIDDLIQTKVLNGKTEKEAISSLRSSLTSYWKPLYLQAYRSGNTYEMYRIRQILYYSGLYGSANEVVKTTQNWLKG